MYMKGWIKKLHDILTINEKEILLDAGRISHKVAESFAENEYDKFLSKQKGIERENSIKELEEELKLISNKQLSQKKKK